MFPVRYIHAADLHLHATFKGLSNKACTASIGEKLQESTFIALERLVNICQKEKPDFLVLAGDIYNQEDYSLKAQLALRDACLKLNTSGIQVFIAHGNHDPISSRLKTVTWPENTIIFSNSVQSFPVKRGSEIVAIVHGISHDKIIETDNLASNFKRFANIENDNTNYEGLFQLGVLHCTVDSIANADKYAPCSIDDLKNTGLDAFALGHIHQTTMLSESPFIVYSGNTQGLHINECGSKGCLMVSAKPQNLSYVNNELAMFEVSSKSIPLAPIVWENISINVSEIEQIDLLEDALLEKLEDQINTYDNCHETLIVRLHLTGRSALDKDLNKEDIQRELINRLEQAQIGHMAIFIKDICIETSPPIDMQELLKRDDLLGKTLTYAQSYAQNQEALQEFAQESLSLLYKHSKAKKVLHQPQAEELQYILEQAQKICVDLLEDR